MAAGGCSRDKLHQAITCVLLIFLTLTVKMHVSVLKFNASNSELLE